MHPLYYMRLADCHAPTCHALAGVDPTQGYADKHYALILCVTHKPLNLPARVSFLIWSDVILIFFWWGFFVFFQLFR